MFRLSARADPAFLAEMLYEAVYWRDAGSDERPPLETMLDDERNARYVQGWGRPGDAAIVALDRNDEPIGAAWYRRFSSAAPGYGYLADDVPEVSIAVYGEYRGQQVGSLLLGALIARASAAGERGLSLSVNRDNPAKRLYARHGFEVVAQHDDTLTMVLELR